MSEKQYGRLTRRRLIEAGLFLSLCAGLWIWRLFPSFLTYYPPFSHAASTLLGKIFSPFPFSAAEIILYILAVFAAAGMVRLILRMIKGPRRLAFLARSAANLLLFSGVTLFLFFALWGMNYQTGSFAARMNLYPGEYTAEQLHDAAGWLLENANTLSGQVPRDDQGVSDFGGFQRLRTIAGSGYDSLARQYPGLFETIPSPPKRVIAGSLMRRLGIAGVYSPFTGESNVSDAALDSELPFVMCHELAHRAGAAREDEANFTAFLACISSPHPEIAYSGWLTALSLCLNALSPEDPDLAGDLWRNMDPNVWADFNAQYLFAKQFEGPAQSVGTAVNNTYLRAMAIQEGVKSYGMAVDLILSYYANHIS